MRFLIMVRSAEGAGPPPKPLMDAIAKAGEEATRAGTPVETGGLFPTAMGARVRLRKGALNATDGPFTESKEVVGDFAIWNVKSKAGAIDVARQFLEMHREHWPGWEGEAEVRQMFD